MKGVKKFFSLVMAVTLLMLPITVHGKENQPVSINLIKSMSSGLKLSKAPRLEQAVTPSDFPLIKPGGFAGTLVDSYGAQYITFNKIANYSSTQMDFQLLYQSDELYNKERYLTIEFYKDIKTDFKYLGYSQFDTYSVNSGQTSTHLDKSLYQGDQYLYILVGISATQDGDYTDAIIFKVENPFNASTSSGPTKYAIISNESVNGDSTENTGSFKINNKNYVMNKKLSLDAYKMDYNKPFNVTKNKAKQIKRTPFSPHLSLDVGDTKDFWVTNISTNQDYQINAKLTYSGTKANVWVYDNYISPQDAAKLGTEFETKIYKSVTDNFAKESDVDGDGKINILVYDIQDGFSGSGGYVAGYFYAGDLFDIAHSNHSEIFYIDSYPTMGTGATKDVTGAYDTLAHEFQHMVNFNQTVFIEGANAPMDTWLNEGLSMAAEQIYSGKVLTDRIDYYNATQSTANGQSLLYWDYNGDVLANYSLSYLLTQYIKLQAGKGDSIFKEILLDKNNNYKAVEDSAQKYINPSLKFGKFMTDFRTALLLKQASGLYGFKGVPEFNQLQPKLFSGSSIDLRGGGAIVKQYDGDFAIPASKGSDITYTLVQDGTDTTPPGKPTVYPVSDKDTAVGGAEAGSKVYVMRGSSPLGSGTATGGGFNIKIVKQKAGTKLSVYVVDSSKNKSPVVTVTVLDKTPPAAPIVYQVKDSDKKVAGKAEAGSKITVKAGSSTLGYGTANKYGNYTVPLKAVPKAGTTLYVNAKDSAGNTSSATKTVVKDNTPPAAPKVDKVTTSSTKVTGKAEAYSTVYVKVSGKLIGYGKTVKDGSFLVKIAKQKAGIVLYVYAKDQAGNVGPDAKVIVRK